MHWNRLALALVIITSGLTPCQTIVAQDNSPNETSNASQAPEFDLAQLKPEQIRTLQITPASINRFGARFHLYPQSDESYNRNAALFYHRAIYNFRNIEAGLRGDGSETAKSLHPRLEDNPSWLETPLKDMPIDAMRSWIGHHGQALKNLGYAMRSKECDWQLIPEEVKTNYLSETLPELQDMLQLSRLLACQLRVQIADRKFSKAMVTIKTCFKLAHDLDKMELRVGSIQGAQCVSMINPSIEELIQHADSPSLYWPIRMLPKLINIRRAIRNEITLTKQLKGYRVGELGDLARHRRTTAPAVLVVYAHAKRWLLEHGMSEAEIEALPTADVVELALEKMAQIVLNKRLQIMTLDYPALADFSTKPFDNTDVPQLVNQHSLASRSLGAIAPKLYLASFYVLQPIRVIQTESQIQRQFAAFQVIEALRLHLDKTGNLPRSLDEISIVPIPINPETGKPFRFVSDGTHATLLSMSPEASAIKVYKISKAPSKKATK